MSRVVTLVLLTVVGAVFVFGAVGVWRGVQRAETAPQTPGTVTDVRCFHGHRNVGRGVSCNGRFTSDDGRVKTGE